MTEITTLQPDEIDQIKPLWEELNRLHEEKSDHFKQHFRQFTFEKRMASFSDCDDYRIFAAKENNNTVGYCIASFKKDIGEIDSIYILPEYRKTGLGEKLMTNAENWLISKNISRIRISVVQGNEEAFGFYEKKDFYHRVSILEKQV